MYITIRTVLNRIEDSDHHPWILPMLSITQCRYILTIEVSADTFWLRYHKKNIKYKNKTEHRICFRLRDIRTYTSLHAIKQKNSKDKYIAQLQHHSLQNYLSKGGIQYSLLTNCAFFVKSNAPNQKQFCKTNKSATGMFETINWLRCFCNRIQSKKTDC